MVMVTISDLITPRSGVFSEKAQAKGQGPLSTKDCFQRRPRGLSLMITVFRRMSHASKSVSRIIGLCTAFKTGLSNNSYRMYPLINGDTDYTGDR